MAFATVDELATILQRSLTEAQADAAEMFLDQATATVKAYTGQQIEAGESTARLKVKGGMVRLPQRPVTAIDGVDNVTGTAVLHTWDAGDVIYLSSGMAVANGPESWPWRYGAPTYVDVTYSHGYETVPDDIKAVVLQMAARALGTPADEGGVSQETVGSYSYSRGTIGAAGAVGLLPDEKAVLDRYRVPTGPTLMVR